MTKLRLLTLSSAAAVAMAAQAQIPLDYYAPLDGLCGYQLKDAIHQVIGADPDISMLGYGSGNLKTWWAFYVTDRDAETNAVVDRYSYDVKYFGDRGTSVSGLNIEHSFPKSWWGGSENNAYKDLFNLMPCESSINQSKSNYPMGVVREVVTSGGDNGCTRVGNGSDGYRYWEPADAWKGDFARGYMYMATAYQDFTWSGDNALRILQQGSYPTLKPAAYQLYLQWARTDAVSPTEVERVERVRAFQGNRNPYVDMPNLMEYVWGDSITRPLDLLTTLKSAPVTGVIPGPQEQPVEVYASTYLGTSGGCEIENVVRPNTSFAVWSNSATYGWTGKASRGSSSDLTRYATDASLVTPVIDLSAYANASVTFQHAVNFLLSPERMLSVYVRDDADDSVTDITAQVFWPAGSNWTFYSSGRISLNRWGGRQIRLVFRYTSTEEEAATWEIKNLSVTASGQLSSLHDPFTDPQEADRLLPAEYYSIDGLRVDPATYRGIVIRRQGSRVSKHLLR